MRSFALALFSTWMVGACAKGYELEGVGGHGVGGDGGDGIGGDGGSAAGDSSGSGAGGSGSGGDGGGSTTTTSSSTTTSGSGGSGGMGGSGGAGGNPCSFTSPNTCASAEQLPDVSGDESGTASAVGAGSKWFKVHIEETSSSIIEEDLGYTVSLISPPGVDYDLYVRQGPQDGNPNCNAAEKKGTLSGGAEVVSDSWDDDQGIGGEDDSLWLSIEVRHVSGDDCNAKWSLTVKGK